MLADLARLVGLVVLLALLSLLASQLAPREGAAVPGVRPASPGLAAHP